MRFHMGIGSKVKRLFISSPVKQQPLIVKNPDAGLDGESEAAGLGVGIKSPDVGSKAEVFFDSKPWLESDCEDDFHSVNGEFTPSRGSTPNYQTSLSVPPSLDKALFVDKFPNSKLETSPTGRKKLAVLLQETLQGEQASNERNAADVKTGVNGKPDVFSIKSGPTQKSLDATPYLSGANSVCSTEATPNRDTNKKDKGRAMHCCLPSLVHNFSFNERRQKMSPVPSSA